MTDARPSLLRRAWATLEQGPLHTNELAKRVMGLDGHPGAAAAAVFALLGNDNRFHADGEGVWRIRAQRGPQPGPALSALSYAVTDVETTGGPYERGHRITEIAIVEVRDGAVADAFETLVNPGRRIPENTTRLTGITNSMVARAPAFDEIAEQVFQHIAGRVFVAHNARFDWGWVRAQLADALGDVPRVERLCTVQLARRLLPGLKRRNLDALSDFFRIPIHHRHRAYGDALATARIFLRMLDRAGGVGIGDLHALQKFRPSRRNRYQRELFDPSHLGRP